MIPSFRALLLGVALLSLSCPSLGQLDFASFDIPERPNASISPCVDFNAHFCNVEPPKRFLRFGLQNLHFDDAQRALKDYQDGLFPYIMKSIAKGTHRNPEMCSSIGLEYTSEMSEWERGEVMGRRLAYGVLTDIDVSAYGPSLVLRNKNGEHEKSQMSLMNAPTFVRALVDTYLNLVNPSRNLSIVIVIYPSRIHEMEGTLDSELLNIKNLRPRKANFHDKLIKFLFGSDRLSSYYNLLFAKVLLKKKVYLGKELQADLRTMFKLTKAEISGNIEKSNLIGSSSKQKMLAALKKLKGTIGLPRKYRNRKNLNHALSAVFAHIKHAYEETQRPDNQGNVLMQNCTLEYLAREVVLARNRYTLKYGGMDPVTEEYNTEQSIHGQVPSYYSRMWFPYRNFSLTVNYPPSFVHVFNRSLPLGMKYAMIGYVMAREVFHALSLHSDLWSSSEHYDTTVRCYSNHYSSFCVDTKDKKMCPSGELKLNEGYADVEGARIAYRILNKALEPNKQARRRRSAETGFPQFNATPLRLRVFKSSLGGFGGDEVELQRKYFFYGLSGMYCSSDKLDQAEFDLFKDKALPRDRIRMHAIAKQIPEFSKLFQCAETDPLYHSKELCQGFSES